MTKEQLEYIKNNPELVVRQVARNRLITFARYMKPKMEMSPFHQTYYRILDMFAHKKIRRLIISVPPQHGKALQVDTPVLTTKGWKRHGDLKVGDFVFGDDGKPKRVEWVSGNYLWHTMNVDFADGFSLIAAYEHEWELWCDRDNRKGRVKERLETQHIFDKRHRRNPYALANAILDNPDKELPIDIYTPTSWKTRANKDNKIKFVITGTSDNGMEMVNCIQVEGGMYLAGRELVPTHNSEGSSRMLPPFILGLNPDTKIIIGSYNADVAENFNRDVQRTIKSEQYRSVFPNSFVNDGRQRMDNIYRCNSSITEMVGHTGGLMAVGRNGSLTSKTVDVSILDDIYKDFQEANSPAIREIAWNWYTTVVRSRLHNNSQELIVFTRWHEDDLIGRIEKSGEKIIYVKTWKDIEEAPKDAWILVNCPAIKTSAPTELDPREEGAPLWPERHSLEKLLGQRKLDPVNFECLYQGDPGSAEGRLYNEFKTYTDKSEYGTFIRKGCCVDTADKGDDFLCSITYDIYKSPNSQYNEQTKKWEPILYALVTDIIFTQEGTDITEVTVPRQINMQGCGKVFIESNAGGASFAKGIAKKVKALVETFFTSANKESRIISNAAAVNRCIVFPLGWEKQYPAFYEHITRFLRFFKGNAHDDGADCCTTIYEKEIASGNVKAYKSQRSGVRRRN